MLHAGHENARLTKWWSRCKKCIAELQSRQTSTRSGPECVHHSSVPSSDVRSYLTYGPLLNRVASVVFEGVPTHPTPARSWEIIDKYQ
eukprot:scaffold202577_cov15-Tisochrysis_lutea.AAC.1